MEWENGATGIEINRERNIKKWKRCNMNKTQHEKKIAAWKELTMKKEQIVKSVAVTKHTMKTWK